MAFYKESVIVKYQFAEAKMSKYTLKTDSTNCEVSFVQFIRHQHLYQRP